VSRKVLITLLAACSLIAYFTYQSSVNQKEKLSSSTSFGLSASGMSLFREGLEQLTENRVKLSKQAVFYEEDLRGVGGYFLFAPKAPVSKRESRLLKQSVEQGMTLFITAVGPGGWERLRELHEEFSIEHSIISWELFENSTPVIINADQSLWPLIEDQSYAFYSQHIFESAKCNPEQLSLDCFVFRQVVGSGQIIIILGFPPVSNALLQFVDNARIMSELAQLPGELLIDEYHHFFSEMSFSDLLLEDNFLYPILFLLIGILLFLFFGETSNFRKHQTKSPVRIEDFHQFTRSLLQGVNASTKAKISLLEHHKAILERKFPEKRGELDKLRFNKVRSRLDFTNMATRLCQLEYNFIKQKQKLT